LPSLIGGSVAVSALWKNMFGVTGYLNHILEWFGIPSVAWLTNPKTALASLILLNAWQFGSTMVIFLAGLKQIPRDLYESAAVDGAGRLKRLIAITLPMLSPVMFFNLVLGIIGAFQQFTSAFVITSGGPLDATYFYALYLYTKAFTDYQIGYASALAWILLVIIAVLTGINFLLSNKWVHYESEGAGG
jgi:multiple sugar transport system permease protein